MYSLNKLKTLLFYGLATLAALLQLGCETTGGSTSNPVLAEPKSSAVLRAGDGISVTLNGIPDPSTSDVQIDDQGFISLAYIGRLQASGNTASELGEMIRKAYISQKIYRELSISVYVTDRFIYVGGEVAAPGRVIWTPDLTLTKAIQAAGGFSLYAKEHAVQVTREQETYTINTNTARKEPSQDPKLFPGDSINIPRSAF